MSGESRSAVSGPGEADAESRLRRLRHRASPTVPRGVSRTCPAVPLRRSQRAVQGDPDPARLLGGRLLDPAAMSSCRAWSTRPRTSIAGIIDEDSSTTTAGLASAARLWRSFIALIVLTMIWLTASSPTTQLDAADVGPGWAIGGWFLPPILRHHLLMLQRVVEGRRPVGAAGRRSWEVGADRRALGCGWCCTSASGRHLHRPGLRWQFGAMARTPDDVADSFEDQLGLLIAQSIGRVAAVVWGLLVRALTDRTPASPATGAADAAADERLRRPPRQGREPRQLGRRRPLRPLTKAGRRQAARSPTGSSPSDPASLWSSPLRALRRHVGAARPSGSASTSSPRRAPGRGGTFEQTLELLDEAGDGRRPVQPRRRDPRRCRGPRARGRSCARRAGLAQGLARSAAEPPARRRRSPRRRSSRASSDRRSRGPPAQGAGRQAVQPVVGGVSGVVAANCSTSCADLGRWVEREAPSTSARAVADVVVGSAAITARKQCGSGYGVGGDRLAPAARAAPTAAAHVVAGPGEAVNSSHPVRQRLRVAGLARRAPARRAPGAAAGRRRAAAPGRGDRRRRRRRHRP